jgi:hypothetical protein
MRITSSASTSLSSIAKPFQNDLGKSSILRGLGYIAVGYWALNAVHFFSLRNRTSCLFSTHIQTVKAGERKEFYSGKRQAISQCLRPHNFERFFLLTASILREYSEKVNKTECALRLLEEKAEYTVVSSDYAEEINALSINELSAENFKKMKEHFVKLKIAILSGNLSVDEEFKILHSVKSKKMLRSLDFYDRYQFVSKEGSDFFRKMLSLSTRYFDRAMALEQRVFFGEAVKGMIDNTQIGLPYVRAFKFSMVSELAPLLKIESEVDEIFPSLPSDTIRVNFTSDFKEQDQKIDKFLKMSLPQGKEHVYFTELLNQEKDFEMLRNVLRKLFFLCRNKGADSEEFSRLLSVFTDFTNSILGSCPLLIFTKGALQENLPLRVVSPLIETRPSFTLDVFSHFFANGGYEISALDKKGLAVFRGQWESNYNLFTDDGFKRTIKTMSS